jgi:hypothetical protein
MTGAPRRTRWRRAQPSSAPSEPREFELPQQGWEQRTITLLHDREETDRICRGWEEVGWCVLAIDTFDRVDHAAHVVRVAVPPPDWDPPRDDASESLANHSWATTTRLRVEQQGQGQDI